MASRIVVPCFNEASRWDADYWHDLLQIPGIKWTFVDDGSSDSTAELARRATEGSPNAVVVQPRNKGKAEAVREGLLRTLVDDDDGGPVGFMDADGAFQRRDVERLVESANERFLSSKWDAVWSSRVALAGRDIHRSVRRHYSGRIAATLLSWDSPEVPYDTQSGLKFFAASDLLRESLVFPFKTRWLFEVEMLHRFQSLAGRSMRIWEEPLMEWRDVPGSKVTFTETLRIGREILTVKRDSRALKNARRP